MQRATDRPQDPSPKPNKEQTDGRKMWVTPQLRILPVPAETESKVNRFAS
ncbi:MAG TPA: hypothetical protein VEF04_00585 [Blastocatellia bacterium]|nr:hypothetical protein [Blastocatellia bacterium]